MYIPHDKSSFKLGHNKSTLSPNAPKFKLSVPKKAPAQLYRVGIDPGLQMDDNNKIGDCTAVALANSIRSIAAVNKFKITIPTAKTVAFYSQSTGYNPADPKTDQGGTGGGVLSSMARDGFDAGLQTRFYGSWGSVEPGDLNAIALVAAELGAVYLCVALAIADQQGDVWDTDTPASYGDTTPGSWGGHAVASYSYNGLNDTDLIYIATWGGLQKATIRWLKSRCVEAYAMLFRQLQPATANERDYGRLETECATYLQNN